MTCLMFLSDQQRAALRNSTERPSLEEIMAAHPSPPVTQGKLKRLQAMAMDTDPKIRESAALNVHSPSQVLSRLAADPEVGVRCCVARNEASGEAILERLVNDTSPLVRGWVAANPASPEALIDSLADDPDPMVQRVVEWARSW